MQSVSLLFVAHHIVVENGLRQLIAIKISKLIDGGMYRHQNESVTLSTLILYLQNETWPITLRLILIEPTR